MSLFSEVDEPEWPEILRALQRRTAEAINCSVPARVKSYDSSTQLATVQPVIQVKGVTLKPIEDVPVVWPGGAGGFFHSGLVEGDNVIVLFMDEDFSVWWESGSISPALVDDRHGLHAVALPGFRREAEPLDVSVGHTVIGADGDVRLGSDGAALFVALAQYVDDRLATIQAAFDAHTHVTTAVTGGGGPPGVIAPPASPIGALASVASDKVKADS